MDDHWSTECRLSESSVIFFPYFSTQLRKSSLILNVLDHLCLFLFDYLFLEKNKEFFLLNLLRRRVTSFGCYWSFTVLVVFISSIFIWSWSMDVTCCFFPILSLLFQFMLLSSVLSFWVVIFSVLFSLSALLSRFSAFGLNKSKKNQATKTRRSAWGDGGSMKIATFFLMFLSSVFSLVAHLSWFLLVSNFKKLVIQYSALSKLLVKCIYIIYLVCIKYLMGIGWKGWRRRFSRFMNLIRQLGFVMSLVVGNFGPDVI